jgi:hypothetical protein
VRGERAVLGAGEREGDPGERGVGTEPDVLALRGLDVGTEPLGVPVPVGAVRPAGQGDHVRLVAQLGGGHLGAEVQPGAGLRRLVLQDPQQGTAGDRGEPVPRVSQRGRPVPQLHVRPADAGLPHELPGGRVGLPERGQRPLGEDHAEAEGGVGRVALVHLHLATRVAQAQQPGQEETGGPAADDDDLERLHRTHHHPRNWRRDRLASAAARREVNGSNGIRKNHRAYRRRYPGRERQILHCS